MGESLAAASRLFGDLVAPQPEARPVTADAVTTIGENKTTHGIAGEWHYDRPNRTRCGRKATGVGRWESGKPVVITCGSCQRLMRGEK